MENAKRFFLCLSRACLGKMISFVDLPVGKHISQKRRFPHCLRVHPVPEQSIGTVFKMEHRQPALRSAELRVREVLRKNALKKRIDLFVECFPDV
jgi:hypothetical protein